jgi:serine/threonine protein kinase
LEVLAFFASETHTFVVMRRVAQDLFGVVESSSGGLGEDLCRHIFRQVVNAVAHLHKHNIVHGDLKMENILVDDDCTVFLSDFGASYNRHSQGYRRPMGTLAFAAPELQPYYEKQMRRCSPALYPLSGLEVPPEFHLEECSVTATAPVLGGRVGEAPQAVDGTKADMWALGILLLQMLTAYPVDTTNKYTMALHHLRFNKRPSQAVLALVQGLLSADPGGRPSASQLLVDQNWLTSV